jgi:hypothetical protein
MTPTLLGRWQTRIFLMLTVGLLPTLLFFLRLFGNPGDLIYLAILGYILLFGLFWDVVYIYIQQLRWDQDWPAVFQWGAAIWEALFFYGLKQVVNLPLPGELNWLWFCIHYSLVWICVFVSSQSLMRIIFPRWRFHGGQWL